MVQLGRLEKETNLRDIWSDEAGDFTPWLAQEENLNLLGKELGIDMELIATEVKTGSFFTDILARDCYTEDKIVIENQLENTNHEHLGKIITYASGHDAKTIIWVVKKVREELFPTRNGHRLACSPGIAVFFGSSALRSICRPHIARNRIFVLPYNRT